MRIHVKTVTDQHLILNVEPSDKIEKLIARIPDVEGIPSNLRVMLLVGGIELENGRTLADYDIQTESVIHAALRIRGQRAHQ